VGTSHKIIVVVLGGLGRRFHLDLLLVLAFVVELLGVDEGGAVEDVLLRLRLRLLLGAGAGLLEFSSLLLLLEPLLPLGLLLGLDLLVLALLLYDAQLLLHAMQVLPLGLPVEQHHQLIHEHEEVGIFDGVQLLLVGVLVQPLTH
jgi:hypothetical protein